MKRREFIRLGGLSMAFGVASGRPLFTQARTPTQEALVFDAMGEIRTTYSAQLLAEILDSGTNVVGVTLSDPKAQEQEAFDTVMAGIQEYDRYIDAYPSLLMKAVTTSDIDRARESGRLALFYLTQNSTHIGRDVDRVDLFYKQGQRILQLTYNHQNWVGAGCKERTGAGLTHFGVQLVEKLNDTGMLIDLSHANMATMADAIRFSKSPVHISHTACAGIYANVRNTSDENLRLLAERDGGVGICQIRPFLTDRKKDNLEAYFRHIEYAVNVAGTDHVCIGSDRDHRIIELSDEYLEELKREEGPNFNEADWPLFIDELNGPRRMEVVWDGLVKLGLGSSDVEKIMGLNLYRLYREVVG